MRSLLLLAGAIYLLGLAEIGNIICEAKPCIVPIIGALAIPVAFAYVHTKLNWRNWGAQAAPRWEPGDTEETA